MIGVLMGGMSAERDISLKSGRAVLRALRSRGYRAVAVEAGEDLPRALRARGVEVAFNALHGKFGEDGAVQGLLEVLGIPYTGSGVLPSALGMNKIFAKRLFERAGLPVAPWTVARQGEEIPPLSFRLPAVVKPSTEGSSIGVTIVRSRRDLERAAGCAWRYDESALVEKYVPGREVTVGVLGGRALAAMEVRPKGEFASYAVKYTPGREEFILPAPLPGPLYAAVLALGEKACEALGVEGYARVDLRVDPGGRPYLLEVNTLPGLTSLSYLPKLAGWAGIGYDDLVERILAGARLKIPRRSGPAASGPPRRGRG